MKSEVAFAVGDSIVVIGTADDGKVGTVLRRIGDQYLIALEEGKETTLEGYHLSLRR